MRKALILAALLLGVAPTFAEEPTGCDKFKWPVDRERAALSTANQQPVASGSEVTTVAAERVSLKPLADAGLPMPPERGQKEGTFAGFVTVKVVAAGTYTVSVSDFAWIDVLQNGNYVRPKDFSGASGCEGLRKTMKFQFGTAPTTVQISGAEKNAINLAILPAAN